MSIYLLLFNVVFTFAGINLAIIAYAKLTGRKINYNSLRATLTDISGDDDCADADSGCKVSYACNITDITLAVWSSNVLTNFTMGAVGKWVKIEPSANDTSQYSDVGERTVGSNKKKYAQEYNGQFLGISSAKREALAAFDDTCKLCVIHFLNNGAVLVQGIVKSTDTAAFTTTKKPAKSISSGLSDQGDNENRYEMKILSESKLLSHHSTLTPAAIEAL